MTTIIIILTIALCTLASVLVIAASMLRCPQCGEWHEEPKNCSHSEPSDATMGNSLKR